MEYLNKSERKHRETNGFNSNNRYFDNINNFVCFQTKILFICSPEILRLSKSNGSMSTNSNKYTSNFNGIKPNDKPTQHTQSYRFVIIIYNY